MVTSAICAACNFVKTEAHQSEVRFIILVEQVPLLQLLFELVDAVKSGGGENKSYYAKIFHRPSPSLAWCRIIRRFARDRDVMDVAFLQARIGNFHKLRALLHVRYRRRADISH